VGRRGDDAAGELVARELLGRGVELVGPVGGRTGVVVSLASAGDRTMASDRGTAIELSEHELDPAWFDADVLHISGYSLLRDPLATAAVRAAELARERGARVSLDVSTWTLVNDAFRERLSQVAPDLLFATEREHHVVGATSATCVIKRGAEGIRVGEVDHPALPGEIVDTTGAGDALAAGYLLGGVQAGLAAAARCCAQMGSMP